MGLIITFSNDGRLKGFVSSTGELGMDINAKDSEKIKDRKIDCVETILGTTTNIKVTMNDSDETDETVYIEATGVGTIPFTKVVGDGINVYSNEEVLKELGITNYTGEYKGTWTVIGREDGKTKLVSTRDVAEYTLGYEDPRAINAIPIKGTTPTDTEKFERAIWSYKNAVNTLHTVAKETTGIPSANSITIEDIYDIIGEENVNKGDEYGREYNYYYEDGKVYSKYITGTDAEGNPTWSTPSNTNYASQSFVDDKGNTVVIDSAGDNIPLTEIDYFYTLTDAQRTAVGSLASGGYWLASPCVDCGLLNTMFGVPCMADGRIRSFYLFSSYGVRLPQPALA